MVGGGWLGVGMTPPPPNLSLKCQPDACGRFLGASGVLLFVPEDFSQCTENNNHG